jgi:Na+/alanine symporter
MKKLLEDILSNKHNKYTMSKVVPFMWFIYLLLALTFKFEGITEIPRTYYDLTIIFSSVYMGRTALDKMKDFSKPPQ